MKEPKMSFPVYVKNPAGAKVWPGADTSKPFTTLPTGSTVQVVNQFTEPADGKVWVVLANANPAKPVTFGLAVDFTPYDQPAMPAEFSALVAWARALGFKG
jgi:hypothetical protein